MRHPISTSIWLLTFVAINSVLVTAQVQFPGRCPEVKIMDTFDLEAYLGLWYENSKYPNVFELGNKCVYARYEVLDESTVSVVNGAISGLTGNPTNVTGTAKVIAPAQLAVSFSNNQESNKANYLVLDTDYDSYAVVYSCSSLTPLVHSKFVWILTRQRKPTDQTINTALKVLEDNKIRQNFLTKTKQNSCPKLFGDGL